MGATTARDLAESNVTLESQLYYHLRVNHFPPVPATMVQVCIDAIDAINEWDPYREIDLPEGVGYKGRDTAPAIAIAQAHHLDAWIDNEDQ
jgi:hypothetical protein